jgi:hypothetical protein
MDLSITLPKYAYKPSVFLVYDDGLSHTRGNMAILVSEDVELAPTRDNAVAFMHKHVPPQFHDTVSYVAFISDQLIPKLQYDQAYLSDDGDLVMHVESYSYEQVDVAMNKGVAGKITKRSRRTGANGEDHAKYFYVR